MTDVTLSPEKKDKLIFDLLMFYERLSDNHPFKNPYFVCIIHFLLTLFLINKLSFRLALKVLLRLLKDGKISLETYREIIAQLIIGGISPVELEDIEFE